MERGSLLSQISPSAPAGELGQGRGGGGAVWDGFLGWPGGKLEAKQLKFYHQALASTQ